MKIAKVPYGESFVYIYQLDDRYYPCTSYFNALLGVVSPYLSDTLDQSTLKNAYVTGVIQ